MEKNSQFDLLIESSSLTEGLVIDSEGNVKFTFKKKGSLMDAYMENHRLLHNAMQTGDYETAKYCLAVAFAAINAIERETYSNKMKDKTAVQARASYINDFKTYSKQLSELQPKFDFATYYSKLDVDKVVIDIPVSTIQGIKQIVKKLLA